MEEDIYRAMYDPINGTTSRMNNPEWIEEKETAEDWGYDDEEDETDDDYNSFY